MPTAWLAWAALLALGAAPAAPVPDSRAARDALISERSRAQNRLVNDLAFHTTASAGCAQTLRSGSSGQKCWVAGLGLEVGFALDRQGPAYGDLLARSLLVAWQPLTLGTWALREEHHFTDFEIAFAEPYLMLRAAEAEQRRSFGFIAGSRAWVGWTVLRAGVELSYEFGPPGLDRGLAVSLFAGLAIHRGH